MLSEDLRSRVLVVDDQIEVTGLIRRALGQLKIGCVVARDGLDALQRMQTQRFDLVVTDLRMPRKHGYSLIQDLLRRNDPPAVAVITAVEDLRLIQDLLQRGVKDVIIKPFSYQVLALKIQGWLRDIDTRPRGMGGAADDKQRVSQDLRETTSQLRAQLVQIQESFGETIRNLESHRDELEAGYADSVRVLSRLITQIGERSESHPLRVEELAVRIAEANGVDRRTLHELRVATLLHEIGQFGMPDHLRTRSAWTLTGKDLVIFQQYPLIGATLVSEIRGADRIAEIIEAHAENFDGSGFPKGLQGTAIPLPARILRVADACDTLRMHHIQGEWIPAVRKHLTAFSGKYYDPDIAGVARRLLQSDTPADEKQGVLELTIDHTQDGMVLAADVYDETGRFLARKGAVLTETMRRRLRALVRFQPVRVLAPKQTDNDRPKPGAGAESVTL